MKAKYIFSGLLAITLVSSCTDKMDYKEYNVHDKAYEEKMFERVGGLMTEIYNDIDYDFGNYSGAMSSSATDESVYSHPGNAIEDFYNGAWGPTNAKERVWKSAWDGITYSNLVLDEFNDCTFPEYTEDEHYQQQMFLYKNYRYEARWARAFFYFELVKRYGNVPLKTRTMTANEANSLPQMPADSIFAFIDKECADIQDSIIVNYGDLGDMSYYKAQTGRANKLAVMALRARAALYWASPLFNTKGDKSRWLKAAQLSNAVIAEARQEGMGLLPDYSKLFDKDSYKDGIKEIIFARRTTASNAFEKYNYPIGIENAGGGNCPTQNLVDAYEMTNGKAIDEQGSGYDPQDPYKNRDARLALTVAVNGENWPDKAALETFEGGANSSSVTYGTPTGYYLKKYVNKGTIIAKTGSNSFTHEWVIFRLAEFYLDYAEAALNYTGSGYTAPDGLPMTAAQAINVVRTRAKQPNMATGLSFDAFKKKYENERFVELAFEGHRFFDLRRWKEAPQYLKNIRGMKITRLDDGTMKYEEQTIATRTWDDKWYLFPFPQKDALNCNFTQNEGWK
ncbi:RagB/SusD family nutrient uptake outer membrane protein [Hallella absiana]|uniref:RagB/SusD family nutrient uptake outer membrane protein n=1 Tax=Hallella absiana TaxID=2925336 RepID=UPI0021C7D02C|nr:RagB/SusD family nutrient uptake outer membrane protein [Hallella absiana]